MKKTVVYIVAIAVITGLLSVVFISIGKESFFSERIENAIIPLQSFMSMTVNSVKSISKKEEFIEENKRLKLENGKLKYEIRNTESLKKENQRLREMLEFSKNNKEFSVVFSEVLGRYEDKNGITLKIDKGKNHGIKVNDTVALNYSLIGKISSVGENWAKLTPIVSQNSSVGVKAIQSEVFAVAEGKAELISEGKLCLFHISEKEKIILGEQIETSGKESIFPSGLLIGKVSEILKDGAIIDTNIDFNSISEVMIIKRRQE